MQRGARKKPAAPRSVDPPRPPGQEAIPSQATAAHREETRRQFEHWLEVNQRLEESLRRFKELYDYAPTGYATLSRSGVIIEINQTGAAMLGALPPAIVGKPLISFIARADISALLKHLMLCRSGLSTVTSDLTLRAAGGRNLAVQLVSTRTWLAGGHMAFHTNISDLTDRRRSEVALAESEQRYRGIVETANEGICIVNPRNHIAFVNRRFADMVGGTPENLLGRPATDLLPEGNDAEIRKLKKRPARVAHVSEVRLHRLDETTVWCSVSTSLLYQGGEYAGMLRMFTDITDRKELEATRERLVRHMVVAQEAERRRVARELHDSMGQHLVGFSLGLKRLAQLAPSAQDAADEMSQIAARLQELTDVMAREIHTLARGLRPAALDDLGLAVAVSNLADEIAERGGLEVDVHCDVADRLDPAAETTIYRVVQEALTNIVKHAKAAHASVILERHGDVVQAIIEDDGVGFHAEHLLRAEAYEQRLGLAGMAERALLVGGEFQIESSPGRGTTLFLRVPVGAKERESHEEDASVAGR